MHGIFGARFLGRREPAWHSIGTVFPADEHVSVAEGILRIGADFHVQKLPLTVKLPDGSTHATDRVAMVRYPTHDDGSYHILGYAGADYEVVQNLELGFMLESLEGEWPLETVGVLQLRAGTSSSRWTPAPPVSLVRRSGSTSSWPTRTLVENRFE
jgi:hypothetical protein